jgi:hypothetical protein
MPPEVAGATEYIALPLPRRCRMRDEASGAPETRPARGQGNEEVRKGQKTVVPRPQPKATPGTPPPQPPPQPRPQGK